MKYKNPLATAHKNESDKIRDFIAACALERSACRVDGTFVPLGSVGIDNVEFIGGLWRVQNRQDYKLRKIRDRQFIMGPRINITEKNYFEYYKIAEIPTFNCYGPIAEPKFNMVAAHYKTDRADYWSYGKDIPSARAFLAIALYDEHMDLIDTVARQKINQHGK